MIDPHGIEWLPIVEAAERVGVKEDTVRKWVRRGKVRAHTIGAGRTSSTFVPVHEVAHAEHDTRGKYRVQRNRLECPIMVPDRSMP